MSILKIMVKAVLVSSWIHGLFVKSWEVVGLWSVSVCMLSVAFNPCFAIAYVSRFQYNNIQPLYYWEKQLQDKSSTRCVVAWQQSTIKDIWSHMMKESLTKLYQAIGLQRWFSKTFDSESFSKAKHDHNNVAPVDPAYASWLNGHPSALRYFRSMMNMAEGKRIVVFLDYDGTLSPIVSDPDRAFMSEPMRAAVRQLSKQFPTAIISGRSRDKVYEFVSLDEIYYAGSHGMDIMAPLQQSKSNNGSCQNRALDKERDDFIIFQPAKDFLPAINKMLKEVEDITCEIKGVKIEDNRFCISVHYRHVRDEDYGMLEAKVQSMLLNYPRFHMTRGKKVLEIRPSIEWNKGNALEYLLNTLGFADSNDVLPLYIGDDRTDEDAFKILKERGIGFPIIVSTTPRDTLASYSLRDPSEVLCFLIRLARWSSKRTTCSSSE